MSDELRHADDKGILCSIAFRLSQLWDFIDKRDIDKHAVMLVIIIGTIRITEWAVHFVNLHPTDSGTDVGFKVAAVMIPWSLIATPAIKWYFDARSS